jgi:hypothetical protein
VIAISRAGRPRSRNSTLIAGELVGGSGRFEHGRGHGRVTRFVRGAAGSCFGVVTAVRFLRGAHGMRRVGGSQMRSGG